MGQDHKRLLFAVLVSVAIMSAWGYFFSPKAPPVGVIAEADSGSGAVATGTGGPAAMPAGAGAAGSTAGAAPAVPEAPEQEARLETPEFVAVFTSHGGALKSLLLKSTKYRRDLGEGQSAPVDLVEDGTAPYPLATAWIGEGNATDVTDNPAARMPMRLSDQGGRITFEGTAGDVTLTKTFRIDEARKYALVMDVTVKAARPGKLGVLYPGFAPPPAKKPGFFSRPAFVQVANPICRASDSTEWLKSSSPEEKSYSGSRWAGIDEHYFLGVIIPQDRPGSATCEERSWGAGRVMSMVWQPVQAADHLGYDVYAGPKQVDLLQGYGASLETSVDYGKFVNLFKLFAQVLLRVMRACERVTHSWGVAIILLTIVVKTCLYPLTRKSFQSALEMRKLAPEIEKLKAKYGNDKEKFGQAQMQLYTQHKVNPLGGCLPMLIQIPIWYALYETIQTSVELYNEPFLWVRDLTAHDPFYVFPIVMGATSFIMQRLSPQPTDRTQATMMMFMPLVYTFIMLQLPAGLTLYFLVSNVLSIAQQKWFNWRHQAGTPAMGGAVSQS